MRDVLDFFRNLGDTSHWPPRWHCGRWTDFHGWLYIASDLLIWSAYFCIPLMIVLFIAKKRREKQNVRFHRIYFMCAAFVLACGTTHLLDAALFWVPAYRISALAHLATGLISWRAVIAIFRILPTAFALQSPERLEQEVRLRAEAEQQLRQRHDRMVAADVAANLCHWTWDPATGHVDWSESTYQVFGLAAVPIADTRVLFRAIHPDDRLRLEACLAGAQATGTFENGQYRVRSGTGIREILVTGTVHRTAAGASGFLSGTVQDVTVQHRQLRRIEEQNRRLRTIAALQSHHVRGPLATILGITQVLERTGGPNDELLAGLQAKALELDGVVQRLVRATRIREGANGGS